VLRRLGAHAAEATAAPDQAHVAVVLVVAHRPLAVGAAAPAAAAVAAVPAAVVPPAGQDADAVDAAVVAVGLLPPVGLRCAVNVGAADVAVGHRLQQQQLQHHRDQHLDLHLDLGQDRLPNPGQRQQWDPRRDCSRLYYRRRQQRLRRRLRGGKRRFG